MKLKNLFTCTVTGLLLCTSCIKDEAPNAEADILNCILPAEMLLQSARKWELVGSGRYRCLLLCK